MSELKTVSEPVRGFDYYLTREQLERYRSKPLELRLLWLYQAAMLRQQCPPETIARQDRYRR